MNAQRNFICLTIIASLTACASYKQKTYVPVAKDFSFSSSPSKAYSKAVDCATRVITVPSHGQFFQYESSETMRFIASFGYPVADPMGLYSSNAQADLRAHVDSDNNELHAEITNPQFLSHASQYSAATWYPVSVDWMVDETTSTANKLITTFGKCFTNK